MKRLLIAGALAGAALMSSMSSADASPGDPPGSHAWWYRLPPCVTPTTVPLCRWDATVRGEGAAGPGVSYRVAWDKESGTPFIRVIHFVP